MRRRLLLALIAVAVGTVVVLGLPLAILGRVAVRNDAEQRADREADAIGFAVVSRLDDGGAVDAALLAPFTTAGRSITVTDREGRLTSAGPPPSGDSIVADVDLGAGARVELRISDGEAERRGLVVVGVVAGLATVAIGGAAVVAVAVARRLNRPVEQLAATARRLGDGDFTARASMSGLVDVDAAASTLNQGAGRIEQMVTAERQFASNASHQLRTPLTALRMRLEEIADIGDLDVRTEADAAIAQADRLDATISELLRLAREGAAGPTTPTDIAAVARTESPRWQTEAAHAGRDLIIRTPESAWALASPAAAAHAVDVLIDNALRHGAGTIAIDVEHHDNTVTLDVADDGTGVPTGQERAVFQRGVSHNGSGLGLSIATTLVTADGGRLTLVQPRPARFRITYRSALPPPEARPPRRD